MSWKPTDKCTQVWQNNCSFGIIFAYQGFADTCNRLETCVHLGRRRSRSLSQPPSLHDKLLFRGWMRIHLVSILLSVEGKIVVYLLNYSKGAIARPAWLKMFWKMSETVLSQSRIWDLEGLILTQFTLELKPTATTAPLSFPVFLVCDAECVSSSYKLQQHKCAHRRREVCVISLSVLILFTGDVIEFLCGERWLSPGPVINELWREKWECHRCSYYSLMQLMRERWEMWLFFTRSPQEQ